MSTMITSAPSRAQVSAWARPWPRDPPVTRATLPSSIPMIVLPFPGLQLSAGVDHVGDAGDVPASIADQVQDRVGDVRRVQLRDGELVQRARRHLEVLPGRVLQ